MDKCDIHDDCTYIPHTCIKCGKYEPNHYICHLIMTARQLCFTCNFWTDLVERRYSDDEGLQVIVNGRHYVAFIDGENAKPVTGADSGVKKWARGFGGAEWRIKFHSGREVTSFNVWHQGEIPANFRDVLPDNAEFVKLRESPNG